MGELEPAAGATSVAVTPARDTRAPIYALAMGVGARRLLLLVSRSAAAQTVRVAGGAHARAHVIDGGGSSEPGFAPPRTLCGRVHGSDP